jgi:hypothetical protein
VAQFGKDKSFADWQVDEVYNSTFGSIPAGTTYVDLLKGIDLRPTLNKKIQEEYERKAAITTGSPLMATGTSYSTTSGSIPVLFQTFVDPGVYDQTVRDTPLASGLIRRVTNKGMFADIDKRTALPTATWKAEMASLESAVSTYTRTAAPMKFMYGTGEISGPALAASNSQGWVNVLGEEQAAQYRALKELEENTIINGDTTSATYTDGFNGLIAAIDTNYTDKSAAELQLADIDTALQTCREAKGHPNLMVTDWRTYYRVQQLMRPIMQAQSGQALNFGFPSISYEGIPIVPDQFMPTSGSGREFLVLDTSTIEMRVLQDATYVEAAKTADFFKFFISQYETMVVKNEAFCYRIYGLA